MNLMRTWAVARKEFTHIRRDPRSLAMGIAMPMVLLLLFGYALTLDVDRVPLVVWDRDESRTSRDFLSRFDGSPYFSIVRYVDNYRDIETAIDSGATLTSIIIPSTFSEDIQSGREARVQLIVDGSDANTATIAIGYAQGIVRTYSASVALIQSNRLGVRMVQNPVDVRPRVWFNADMVSRNYIIPGLIAVIMMVIAALLTSLTIAREWETGTMEQIISTPLRPSELLIGKLIPYFAIGMFDVLIAVLMAEFVFEVPFRGTPALAFGAATMFLIGALSLGMLISTITKSQLLASQLALILTFLPSVLLSGFVYYIENMPVPIQAVTHLVPARYFVSLLRGIYLKGIGPTILVADGVLLIAFAIGTLAIGTIAFKKKIGVR